MDWKEWFDNPKAPLGHKEAEEMYQAFKARMIEESIAKPNDESWGPIGPQEAG